MIKISLGVIALLNSALAEHCTDPMLEWGPDGCQCKAAGAERLFHTAKACICLDTDKILSNDYETCEYTELYKNRMINREKIRANDRAWANRRYENATYETRRKM